MFVALLLVGGLVALIAGARLLVSGASRLALAVGVSPLVVGLTVVSIGTSAPELAVSVQSARSGQGDIAIGNVVGSNLFNVLFVLGASALITPLVVSRQVIRQEVPIMIGVSLLLVACALDGTLDPIEGALFVTGLGVYTAFLAWQGRREGEAGAQQTTLPVPPPARPWRNGITAQAGLIVVGLLLLVIGSNWLVDGAVALAVRMGVSELVIGLTIVAIGTSLPEVATSVMAAVRGERDIAVGNVVGSNIFNILGVLGVAALVAPANLSVAPSVTSFDLPAMTAVAVACLPVFLTGGSIARWEGALFLLYYAAYTAFLLMKAQQHDLLDSYSAVMVWVVMPLTALTLLVLLLQELRLRAK